MRNPWYKGTEAKKKMDEKTAWRRHVNLVRTFFFLYYFINLDPNTETKRTCMVEMIMPRCMTN